MSLKRRKRRRKRNNILRFSIADLLTIGPVRGPIFLINFYFYAIRFKICANRHNLNEGEVWKIERR